MKKIKKCCQTNTQRLTKRSDEEKQKLIKRQCEKFYGKLDTLDEKRY